MLYVHRFCLILLTFCVLGQGVKAQSYTLELHPVDSTPNIDVLTAQLAKNEGTFPGSAAALSFIQDIVPTLQEKGFLSASVDSIAIEGNAYHVYVFLGKHYKWAKADFDSIPQGVMLQAALKKEQWYGRPLNPRQVSRVSERLLIWAENNGYPFARVWLDAISINASGAVDGSFRLDTGPQQNIDTIVIAGDVKVSRGFLLSYLDIEQGEPYNEKKLRNISPRLRELPFLQEAQRWSMEFKLSGNVLNLHLREKKANQLDAIIGLLPNNTQTGKFLLTVDAKFAFQNILSRGETISLSYQNLQYKSPRLKADLVYPYIFNTPFGVDAHFDLFKRDTTFRRTSLQAGIRYQLSPTDYLRAFYQNQSNRLITIDTGYVRSNKKLPENIDVSANGAGLEISFNRTDYRINPRKGWEVAMTSSALIRQIRKTDAITALNDGSGFNYAALYDSLLDRQYQYLISGHISNYLPLGKKAVFKTGYSGGWIGGKSLFRNELYQLGGFRLLRGFDEQSIFASQYHVLSLELRLLLDQNSYFYLFSDNGYITTDFSGFYKEDIYNGFGLGTTLETKSGLFTISFGLGRNSANPVQFRQSKIHFGYVAFF
jgi:outer membrane protein assembly factor BamA